MNISNLISQITEPALFSEGSAVMWTDPHIAKQLLQVHLNPDVELASRRKSTIDITVDWILTALQKEGAAILDLGCGPGLYCMQYAERGHRVTGVDFSGNSITYARERAEHAGLHIDYRIGNYCDITLPEESFDCITLIYTDFGVLSPDDQQRLLSNIKRWLKPGGLFIFDLLSEDAFESAVVPRSWESSDGGFWREGSYVALSETIPYNEEKVVLSQHVIFDEREIPAVYRFWTQYFTKEKIDDLLTGAALQLLRCERGVIPDSDFHKGSDLLFTVAQK